MRMKIILVMTILWVVACKEKTSPKSIDKFNEQHRPQIHFTPEANWMNDPNGLVYLDGEYHLFYQYYPDSTVWGPMHWGHAVSKDMLKWEDLPIALYPDSLGLIFSGSAVIDKDNTSGFGANAMVAIFTHHNMDGEKAGTKTFQNQSIAYSLDKGRTFTKYADNPVVKNPGIKDFRDPKVIWHEPSKQWVMVFAAYDRAMFYTSPDLKSWTKASEFGIPGDDRLWECPDLFPIKIENSTDIKWVLITSIQKKAPNGGTATSYFVGDFDGKTFTADIKKQQWLDYGKDNYAFVTFSNMPDSSVTGLGWMSNWEYAQVVPTSPWRSAMTLPRKLTLHKVNGEYLIKSHIVSGITNYEKGTIKPSKDSKGGSMWEISDSSAYKITVASQSDFKGLRWSNSLGEEIVLGYNPILNQYDFDRTKAGKHEFSDKFGGVHHAQRFTSSKQKDLTIYVDRSSIEVFADGGLTCMTEIMFPTKAMTTLRLLDGSDGDVHVVKIEKMR